MQRAWAELPDPNDLALLQQVVLRKGGRLPPLAPAGLPQPVHAALDALLSRCFAGPPSHRPPMDHVSGELAEISFQAE